MDTSLGAAVCRICMCGETSIPYNGKQAGEPLISPCKCSGTMGLYHRSCLEHWLTVTNTSKCEICKFQFKLGARSRSFFDYIWNKGYGKHRNPLIDFGFAIIITPIAIFALMLCVKGARQAGKRYHAAFENRFDANDRSRNVEILNETSMEFALFVFISVIIFFSLTIFLVIMLVNHWTQFKKWQKKNRVFFVIDQLDTERSLLYNPKTAGFLRRAMSKLAILRRRGNILENVRNGGGEEGIGMESLIVGRNTTVIVMEQSPAGMRKTQSVYSVCSFGNGVMVCSTPVSQRLFSPTDLPLRFSSTQPIEEEHFEQIGRFQVERLD
ncbi:unnamed protein product [Caenorhabditis angaria]|uniref:RING-CH-type domain-containing protein n=1 Tax=Caenorhabditis angaria TaxID=860376 RepID=A0A9P1MT70_9PELO|nr:unnamed protein product [Caenorhabditis angaria]